MRISDWSSDVCSSDLLDRRYRSGQIGKGCLMSQLYLFARIGGADVAVRTEEIEAVVKLTDISPVPGVPPHVAGLSALRSRVLTIIDTAALVQGRHAEAQPDSYAIITNIEIGRAQSELQSLMRISYSV